MKEGPPNVEHRAEEENEPLPTFPIIEDSGRYRHYEHPELQEGIITHFFQVSGFPSEPPLTQFGLKKTIGSQAFIFLLGENPFEQGIFTLNTETEKYGYAVANLNAEDGVTLFKIRAGFVESVASYAPESITAVHSHPASTPHTIEDIESGIAAVLSHPDNTQTREEIYPNKYEPGTIFHAYRHLFGKEFPGHGNRVVSRGKARSRLFKQMFKKYLKNWTVEDYPVGTSFKLVRNK